MTTWKENLRNDGLFISCLAIMAGCAVGYGIAEGLGKLQGDVNAWIAADNFVTFCVAMWTAVIWYATFEERLAWKRAEREYIRTFLSVLLVALAIHRGYWYPWRSHLFYANAEAAQQYSETYVMLTTIPQSVWWFSCFVICAPFYRRRLGDAWPLYAVLITAAIWTVGYQGVAFFQ